MAITPTHAPAVAHGQHKPQAAAAEDTHKNPQKAGLNVAILKATEATISAKDSPMALLLKTAIENINDILAPEMGENAIQKAYEEGVDVSPEATAQRIVDFATGFYHAFKEQHAGEDEAEVLDKFINTITNGVDQGFKEARDILESLEVLEGDIATNIDKTYELVIQGFEAFRESIMPSEEEQA